VGAAADGRLVRGGAPAPPWTAVSLAPERRRKLQDLGLRALVKRRFGAQVAESARRLPFAGGVALAALGPDATLVAVFADSPTGLGPAVDVARREGAAHLYFFAERNTPAVARRAAEFGVPTTVVSPDGDFEGLAPEDPPVSSALPALLGPAAGRMAAAGLDVVWEHGVLIGEWLGLPVAQATLDPGRPDGVALDVGVGKHDREATRMLHPGGVPDEALREAVRTVRGLRVAGAAHHPANQLVPERWLRTVLRRHPALLGLGALEPGPPPEPRGDLRDRGVAPAWALGADRRPVLVVCSVGVDPDLVAQAGDARLQAPSWPGVPPEAAGDPGGWRLLIAVPEGDDHPLTRRLAALLRQPADVLTVRRDWRALAA